MLSGNKGEWSEIYVFLKLLADGKLDTADANLNAIPNVYYPIIRILRQETTLKKYRLKETSQSLTANKNILLTMPVSNFVQKSQELFNRLKAQEEEVFNS